MGGFPNFSGFLTEVWDSTYESCVSLSYASNVVLGGNPPYSISDFLNMFPKYAGKPTPTTAATITQGSTAVTLATPGLGTIMPGQLIIGAGIAPASVIASATPPLGIVLSLPATQTLTNIPLSIYMKPLVPLFVINAYINLASASLVYLRWFSQWNIAMAYYVAHFCALYLQSEGCCDLPCGAAMAAGLKQGIQISASAGGVSQGMVVTPGLDDWGAWNQTAYGVQLATWAKSIGSGPMFIL